MQKVGKLNLRYLMAIEYACLLKIDVTQTYHIHEIMSGNPTDFTYPPANEPHKHNHWVVLSKLQEAYL